MGQKQSVKISTEEENELIEQYLINGDFEGLVNQIPQQSLLYAQLMLLKEINDGGILSEKFKKMVAKLAPLDEREWQKFTLRADFIKFQEGTQQQRKEIFRKWLNRQLFRAQRSYYKPSLDEVRKGQFSLPSELDLLQYDVTFDKVIENSEQLYRLSQEKIRKLPADMLSNKLFSQIYQDNQTFEFVKVFKGWLQKVAQCIRSRHIKGDEVNYNTLSIDEIEYLQQQVPDQLDSNQVMCCLLQKEFYPLKEQVDLENFQDQYSYLKNLINRIKDYPPYFSQLRVDLQLNLLQILSKIEDYNEEELLTLISLPNTIAKGFTVQVLLSQNQQLLKNHQQFLLQPIQNTNQLIEEFLLEILPNKDNFKPYDDFIELQQLKKLKTKGYLLKTGQLLEETKEWNSLIQQVMIEPCKSNPKQFDRDQVVKFSMWIKNVSHLQIKAYQINALAYYRSMQSEIQTDIQLDGLMPKYSWSFDYTDNPAQRIRREFEFQEFGEAQGLYIIDFYGNTRHSRVVIKRGFLKYISKTTAAGQLLTILDENNQICNKKGAGVYIDNKFYQVQNDIVQLPVTNDTQNKQIIITDGQIAEFIRGFQHLGETYEFYCDIFSYEESFITGNSADVCIKPKLYMNQQLAPLEIIQDLKATLVFTCYETGQTTKVFEDLQIENGYCHLKFDVPTRLMEFKVEVTGKIVQITRMKLEKDIKYSKTFQANKFYGNQNHFYSYFLRITAQDEAVLQVRGFNGEPIQGLRLEAFCRLKTVQEEQYSNLETDLQGNITLKNIKHLKSIRVEAENRTGAYFNLNFLKEFIQYPKELILCQGDIQEIPLKKSKLDENNVRFYKSFQGQAIRNMYSALSFDEQQRSIIIQGLQVGEYILNIRNQAIKIHVSEGEHFQDSIIGKNFIVPQYQQFKTLQIKSIELTDNKVQFKVAGGLNDSIITAFFYNYSFNQLNQIITDLEANQVQDQHNTQNFNPFSSAYLPSRLLDEETQYVLNRQNCGNIIGNSLSKPQMLIQRRFIQDTKTDIQRAQEGEHMMRACMQSDLMNEMDQRCMMGRAMAQRMELQQVSKPPEFNSTGSKIVSNVFVDSDGNGLIEDIDLGLYSNIFLVAQNNQFIATKHLNLGNAQIQRRDLRQMSQIDANLIQTMKYKQEAFYRGQEIQIEDVQIQQYEVIDNMQQLTDYLLKFDLANSQYMQIWKYFLQWPKLSQDQKNDMLSRQFGHELNIFTYFKDREYFNYAVYPLLRNKIEKDFIDKYLLEEPLDEYCNIAKINELNLIEKLLFIERLASTNPELSQAVSVSLRAKGLQNSNDISQKKLVDKRLQILLQSQAKQVQINEEEEDCSEAGIQFFEEEERSDRPQRKMLRSARTKQTARRSERKENIVDLRKQAQAYYSEIGSTKEYGETYYFLGRETYQNIKEDLFVVDLVDSALKGSLLTNSSNIIQVKEASFYPYLMAFIDLPFKQIKHNSQLQGRQLTVNLQSNAIFFTKRMEQSEYEQNQNILLGYQFLDPQNKFTKDENGNDAIRSINRFLTQRIYLLQVNITNTSNSYIRGSILINNPNMTIPLSPVESVKSIEMVLQPYNTETFQHYFYFPEVGDYHIQAPSFQTDGIISAIAKNQQVMVRDFYEQQEAKTFKEIACIESKEKILKYIAEKGVRKLNQELEYCFYCFEDQDFLKELLNLHKETLVFNNNIWEYATCQLMEEELSDLIKIQKNMTDKIGYYYRCKYFDTQNLDQVHLEYDPLINARYHRLGQQNRITNKSFNQTYHSYIRRLLWKPELDRVDRLILCQYLIYQEKIQHAKTVYHQIGMTPSYDSIKDEPYQLQFDLLTCYLFFEQALTISRLYLNYPIKPWRQQFEDVYNMFQALNKQIEGEQQSSTLYLKVAGNDISITYQNLTKITLRFYKIDIELLFSKQPFMRQNFEFQNWVNANDQLNLDLDESTGKLQLKVPDSLQNRSIYIVAQYGTQFFNVVHMNNNLEVHIDNSRGKIRVFTSDLTSLPGAYIKVFAKQQNGSEKFYKDGYTDPLGQFDYVSLNSDSLQQVEKFSVLVKHELHGEVIMEANKPN